MEVIDVQPEHHDRIEEIHKATGAGYAFPDLNSPLVIVKKVVKDDQGRIIACGVLRIMAETVITLSPDLSPHQKMEAMESLQAPSLAEAYALGLDDVEARIPKDIETGFEKRLQQLGWHRDRSDLQPWIRKTK
jgi:hypothetical protein